MDPGPDPDPTLKLSQVNNWSLCILRKLLKHSMLVYQNICVINDDLHSFKELTFQNYTYFYVKKVGSDKIMLIQSDPDP